MNFRSTPGARKHSLKVCRAGGVRGLLLNPCPQPDPTSETLNQEPKKPSKVEACGVWSFGFGIQG